MRFEDFVYPPYATPLVEAYEQRFESVFIVLHPFVRVPDALAWKRTRQYPSDAQTAALGIKGSWAEASAATGIETCARMSQGLLTSIGSLAEYLCDYAARDALRTYLQTESVWMPGEGGFETLLRADFLAAFETAGFEDLVFVPEFPQADAVQKHSVAALRQGAVPFPERGSLVAPDGSFLFTVDWDSFFTLFYGPRNFVQRVVKERGLEGFFAEATTEHLWFNYTLGCATVTVSPEGWPARAVRQAPTARP